VFLALRANLPNFCDVFREYDPHGKGKVKVKKFVKVMEKQAKLTEIQSLTLARLYSINGKVHYRNLATDMTDEARVLHALNM
jgi:hypothetical protein